MKVGFTGTQKGMTNQQARKLIELLLELHALENAREFHHGDCVGADAHFHHILVKFMKHEAPDHIYIHPPDNTSKRAWCYSKHIFPVKPYIERNHDIVDAVDILIATPKTRHEELRSGTWATIRYARKTGKEVHVIYPERSSE